MSESSNPIDEIDAVAQPHVETNADVAAWQMIEPGRYQPRRIKGSCVGRELG